MSEVNLLKVVEDLQRKLKRVELELQREREKAKGLRERMVAATSEWLTWWYRTAGNISAPNKSALTKELPQWLKRFT